MRVEPLLTRRGAKALATRGAKAAAIPAIVAVSKTDSM